jgi:ankyrin repeat protein
MLLASSAIIDDIRTLQRCGLASLAFFYCDFRDDQKKDLRGLLSSLLVQLGGQSDAYSTVLFDFYVAHGRGSQHASDSELVDCLKDMLNHPGQATVHIAIDALNECPLTTDFPPPREKVLELVDELVNWHLPNLRICVTSRPEADIVPILEPLASCSVSLHGESGQVQDIAEYVRFFVHTNREMKRWSSTNKQLVIDELTNKADGMCVIYATITYLARLHLKCRFHWVICQLVYLSRCIPGRIRHALNELPRTLDATYARTLQEIDEQNWYYAHRLFQCVAATSRPLRAEELAEFLAFDFEAGSTPKFMADWRSEDPQNAVLSICSTLLVVVKPHLGSPVIQFAHFSVKEYLTSTRLAEAKDTISRFYVSMTPAHAIVAQACLGVLLHLDENITEDSLKDFPLAEYAAEHWVDHARFEGVPPIAEDGMKQLFDPSKPHLAICVWIYDPAVPTWKRLTRNKTPLPPPRSSLHHAAFWGLHPVVEFLIIEHSQDVCSRDSTDNSAPLHLASRNGYVETVYKLIEHSADPTAQNKDGETPLHLALEEGEVEVARMLIERGADPTAKNNYGETPLHLASQMGQVYITRMLIERGADLTAQKNNGWTPLHAALDGGHQSVALLLLERGAEIGCLDSQSRTPLHIACRGCTDVVSVLIDRGVDLNAEDDSRETPLHVASQWGHDDIIRLLLDHDADADRLDDGGWAPLHVASHEGHDKIVQLLFDAGADANRPDNGGWTPLHLTSWEGHEQIVRLLLDHGINANHPDNGGWNPLHAASQEGHNHIVELLLDHGADPHHANSDGSTSLHIALQKNRHYIVQLLLDHGADPNYPNSDGSTLLHLASQRGQDNTVRLLLHHGAFANRLNGDGWASLHLASQRGHYDVVELLLEHGADSNHAHSNGLTPLHLASQEGHDHVVRLLLDHGADANSLNSDGGTPLHLALQKGHDRIVQLLLEHDADADHPNDDSLTPMGFGSREGGAKWKRLASATRKRRRM